MKAKINKCNYINKTINISGSKNSALPIICAAILCDENITLHNIPEIKDVQTLIEIMNSIGYGTSFNNNTLEIINSNGIQTTINDERVSSLRGSYYFIGALLGKTNHIKTLYPGGCNLGKRPIDYHLEAFRNMGASIIEEKKYLTIQNLGKPFTHNLKFPSVGTTINIILASVKLNGLTCINNAAIEPEVIDVCNFLKSMGANINVSGTTITIEGVEYLHYSEYTIISDRIEAGTFLILGALHDGIKIRNANPEHLTTVLALLKTIGCIIKVKGNIITLIKNQDLVPFNVRIGPYPQFPTDLGPQLAVLATQINGESTINDIVYNKRLAHVHELKRMRANIEYKNETIIIYGKVMLEPHHVKAHDLRCAAALVLAASMNEDPTTIHNIDVLFRGYEDIGIKLRNLGFNFRLV